MFLIPLVLSVVFAFVIKRYMDHRSHKNASFARIAEEVEAEATAGEVVNIILTIDSEAVEFEFDPNVQTPELVAFQYCEQERKINKRDEAAMRRCVAPVAKALHEKLASVNEEEEEEESRRLQLEVNGVVYFFEYHRDMDSEFAAHRLAFEFCTSKGEALGFGQAEIDEAIAEEAAANVETENQLDDENQGYALKDACVNPMAERLKEEIDLARAKE